jgi:pimeloyl-ACP methyl ester carboxylesterase
MKDRMIAERLGKVPIYFGAAERPLFGFYHPPAGAGRRPMGVLLCNPLGDDLIRAHRTLRHLAETLSAAGFPVLRFDFDGTGDSAGDERDRHRVAAWRAAVGRAAAELRARSGVQALAIVGLQLGATFAMLAAEDLAGVDALVLWGPYANGKTFVSDVTRAHKMHKMLEPMSFSGGPAASDGQEALGFLLTTETMEELGGVDLLAATRPPAKRTLVIETANVSTESPLVAHLNKLGGAVTRKHMPGEKFLITTPHLSEVPTAVIEAVTTWLAEGVALEEGARQPALPASSTAPSLGERAVVFGKDRPLFGILTSPPPGAAPADLPAIIMTNAGTVHRIGAHRLYVPMARKWAALGFHVFRIDLSGIGDSPVAEGCEENLTYPRDGLDDARAAMDFLTESTGIKRFVVTGLCSGGDITFQLGCREPRVASAIMINPRTFCVHDLGMVDSYQRARWYQASLLRTDSWKKLLRGDVNIARAVRIVAPQIKDVVVSRAKRAMTNLLAVGRRSESAEDKALETDVPRCLRAMAERGVDTFLLVTEKDPGVDYIDANYGRPMSALASVPGFRRVDVKGTDHTFTAQWSQEHVGATITDHLMQRFLGVRAA